MAPGCLVIRAARVKGLRDEVDGEIQVTYVSVTSSRTMRDAGDEERKVGGN